MRIIPTRPQLRSPWGALRAYHLTRDGRAGDESIYTGQDGHHIPDFVAAFVSAYRPGDMTNTNPVASIPSQHWLRPGPARRFVVATSAPTSVRLQRAGHWVVAGAGRASAACWARIAPRRAWWAAVALWVVCWVVGAGYGAHVLLAPSLAAPAVVTRLLAALLGVWLVGGALFLTCLLSFALDDSPTIFPAAL